METKRRLEDFIKENRAAFDDQEPPADVWPAIQEALPTPTPWWNNLAVWRVAAAIGFATALCMGLWIWEKQTAQESKQHVLTEFYDVERYYQQQMAEKVSLIDQFQKNDGLNGFTRDFQQLEAMYLVLREEMKKSPSQKVQEALVLNLLVRLDLLNQRIYKLEQQYGEKENKTSDNPKANT